MEQVFEVSLYRPKPDDLVAFLPYACRQLEAPFPLRIVVETVEDQPADDKKSKREKTPATSGPLPASAEREPSGAALALAEDDEVVLLVRADSQGRALELQFRRCVEVPRLLLKIIGLCIPYHERLARIAVADTPLDGAVLYELAKFLPLSQIAEVLLDDAPAVHRNYHLLLEPPSRLRVLRLARCGLGDEECAALAVRLAHPLPASRSLACLSLEGNRIGDGGARALADALRTNRTLRHLNLAGNVITSVGAAHLFHYLLQFPVSAEDIVSKRKRTFEYLKLRRDAYEECYRRLTETAATLTVAEAAHGRAGRARRQSVASVSSEALASRAATLAAQLVEPWSDPFDPDELVARDGVTYCVGNFALSYLNLAYNELDSWSARRVADVLAYQAAAGRAPGLVRVVLEGNPLPGECAGARAADALLQRLLDAAAAAAAALREAPHSRSARKSERPKFK